MATYYMLPGCTSWSDSAATAGWATTSGGASISAQPGGTDTIIIDANSGAARTITISGYPSIQNMTATNSAAISFSGGTGIFVYGTSVINIPSLGSIAWLAFSTGSSTFTPPTNAQVSTVYLAGSSVTLAGNLNCAQFNLTNNSGTFSAGAYNVTCGSVIPPTAAGVTLNLGSGTWTVSGTGIVWDATYLALGASTATLRFTNNSTSAKTFQGAGKTYYNLWNDTAGGGDFIVQGNNVFNQYRASAGTLNSFQSVYTQTAASWLMDGSAAQITVRSTSGSATLAKSGGGVAYFDRCIISNISASPAATFYARSYSVDNGGNTGWTFIRNSPNFFAYF